METVTLTDEEREALEGESRTLTARLAEGWAVTDAADVAYRRLKNTGADPADVGAALDWFDKCQDKWLRLLKRYEDVEDALGRGTT